MTGNQPMLGCDTGESPAGAGRDRELSLLPYLDAVSIACGGHAGDQVSMRIAIEGALEHDCTIGAHPSYPDRDGFGRRSLPIERSVLRASLLQQLESLSLAAELFSARIEYIKAHGALYHDLASNPEFMSWFVELLQSVMPDAGIVLPVGCPQTDTLRAEGVVVLTEGFCDRAYDADGSLRSRAKPGALITSPSEASSQALDLIQNHACDLLCVHSDSPDAQHMVRAVRSAMDELPNQP
jgi:UPF0271 protein